MTMNELAIIFKIYYKKDCLEFYPISVEEGNYNNKFFKTMENRYRHITFLFESTVLSNPERYCYALRNDIDVFMTNDPEVSLEEIKDIYFNAYRNCHILVPYYRFDFLHNSELIMVDSDDNPLYFKDKDVNQREITYGSIPCYYEQNYNKIQRWIEDNNDEIDMISVLSSEPKSLSKEKDSVSRGTIIQFKRD